MVDGLSPGLVFRLSITLVMGMFCWVWVVQLWVNGGWAGYPFGGVHTGGCYRLSQRWVERCLLVGVGAVEVPERC